MAKVKTNRDRERRIEMEVVVDAYDEYERAAAWYSYLHDRLVFPFTASCINKRATSPLRVGDEVEVGAMADQDQCDHEVFVVIRWERGGLGVPLSQLQPLNTDEPTCEAVEDWHYWTRKGYRF